MNKLFTTVLPSVMVGALLFGSALSGAQPGTPVPPTPPTAPVPGSPAMPPKPPKAPKLKGHINIDLGDLDQMVDEQIENALEAIGDNDQIPEHVRESLKKRLEKVRVKVKARIGKLSPQDFDKMGEELGKMGDEIGAEMDQFGKDMDKWGKD
ncbi:MAG TPA: hypothetical protein VFV99_21445, partial [Kofleriaceae bacterium]|nr:hypothetical protein [Kofleriaceae bacterium]